MCPSSIFPRASQEIERYYEQTVESTISFKKSFEPFFIRPFRFLKHWDLATKKPSFRNLLNSFRSEIHTHSQNHHFLQFFSFVCRHSNPQDLCFDFKMTSTPPITHWIESLKTLRDQLRSHYIYASQFIGIFIPISSLLRLIDSAPELEPICSDGRYKQQEIQSARRYQRFPT